MTFSQLQTSFVPSLQVRYGPLLEFLSFWRIDFMTTGLEIQNVWAAEKKHFQKYSFQFGDIFGNFEKA